MAKIATLTLPDELLQRHTEAFFEVESELRVGRKNLVGAQLNGIAVRAAARLGWLDVTEEEVGDLKPYNVTDIATKINDALADAYALPGE